MPISPVPIRIYNEQRQSIFWYDTGNDGVVVWLSGSSVFYLFGGGDVMSFWVVLNIFFAWFMLKWAKRDFENGRNGLGWMNLVFSAWNAAAAANVIF